jgi:hypothetical protein
MAKQTFMARVKAYRKLHPRTSQVDAMKKLAGKKPAKRAVGTAKKAKKKSIIKTERITTIGSTRKKSTSPLARQIAIACKIEGLELLLKVTRGTVARNDIKRLINAEHDKLERVTPGLKRA